MFTLKATSLPLPYWIYENHFHQLTSWNNQPFLSPANLKLCAQAISRKGSPLKIVLVLWTELYVKFQDLVITSTWCIMVTNVCPPLSFRQLWSLGGSVANLYGSVEGRRHDAGILEESGLLNIFFYYYFLVLFYFILFRTHKQLQYITFTIHYR